MTENRSYVSNRDRLVVAAFVLLLLGASFLVFLTAFAIEYALPAAMVYVVLAVLLLRRVLTKGKTAPSE